MRQLRYNRFPFYEPVKIATNPCHPSGRRAWILDARDRQSQRDQRSLEHNRNIEMIGRQSGRPKISGG
jgi:hypothetical protein